jgi:hypothetical protein
VDVMTEYQFAGDREAHGVPINSSPQASNR